MSHPTLERAIGPGTATLLVIGGIIRSEFFTTGFMATAMPSPTLIMIASVRRIVRACRRAGNAPR
jgi:hypothetical protein